MSAASFSESLRNAWLCWSYGMGDRGALAWLAVAGYAVAAVLCGLCAGRLRAEPLAARRAFPFQRLFWTSLAVALVLLGLNKQLDVQTLFTAIGRELAEAQGWIAYRRAVQATFVVLAVVAALAAGVALAWSMRRVWRRHALVLLGIGLLAVFVLFRVATFYHVGHIEPKGGVLGVVKWGLEYGALVCIIAGAARRMPGRKTRGES